jgi:hypothetical protein
VLRVDDIAADKLQRHEAVEVEIARGVHDTHSAGAEKALDAVMTYDVSDPRRATLDGEEAHDGGFVYKAAGFEMCGKQPFDLDSTLGVCTRMLKKRTALLLRSSAA